MAWASDGWVGLPARAPRGPGGRYRLKIEAFYSCRRFMALAPALPSLVEAGAMAMSHLLMWALLALLLVVPALARPEFLGAEGGAAAGAPR